MLVFEKVSIAKQLYNRGNFLCCRLVTQYDHAERSSWIGLPPSMAGRLLSEGKLPLTFKIQMYAGPGVPVGHPFFLSWSGGVSEAGKMSISARLGTMLHLQQGATVILTPLLTVATGDSVILEPSSSDDWEVVELNAQIIEDQLLTQSGVASIHHPLVVWIQGQMISLKVSSTKPAGDVVRLIPGTEVAIAPRPSPSLADKAGPTEVQQHLFLRLAVLDNISKMVSDSRPEMNSNEDEPRVYIPSSTLERCKSFAALQENHILGVQGGGKFQSEFLARLIIWDSLPHGHLVFDSSFTLTLRRYGIREFNVLRVRCLGTTTFPPLYLENYWKKRPTSPLVPFSTEQGDAAEIKAMPCDDNCLEQCLRHVYPILCSKTRSVLQYWGAPRWGALIVEGPQGSGKTAIVKSLCNELQNNTEVLAATKYINCRDLTSVKSFFKAVNYAFSWATKCAPAIVVLDDLDVAVTEPVQDEGGHEMSVDPDVTQIVRVLCEGLDGLVRAGEKWLPSAHPGAGCTGAGSWPAIVFIATCKQASKLPKELRHVFRFDTVISTQAPTSSNRLAMLDTGLARLEARALEQDLRAILPSIDGFDGSDIEIFISRALNESVRRLLGDIQMSMETPAMLPVPLPISMEDLKAAAEGMVPSAMWGSRTKKTIQSGIEGWCDVGGMSEIQEALQESLELPLKYPQIFASSPLRLRTGALLYGPPGCGKTHVVAAAVAATGVRCIVVNGPELLNKYIGASEAAVRDVFQRAAAAAPSVLFFDEFDAIAPKRGHDNTGVGDRVVNQLLTELDGVEGLKGVVVVAATSRPDLIDAALLRPGRLDRMLYCGFPSSIERVEILKALSRKLQLSKDVNFEDLAWKTEGFSGADLEALLSEAQLIAAHESLEKSNASRNQEDIESLKLNYTHIAKALEDSRPSVSKIEKERLDQIYKRFKQGDIEIPPNEMGQKVTCA